MTDRTDEVVDAVDQDAVDKPTEDNIASLKEELAASREAAAANEDKYLRARAEMENVRKRLERTYADRVADARKDLLRRLLTVKDNLERALAYGEHGKANEESLMEGVRLTSYQLDQLLESQGVRPIEAVGEHFDPRLEEAVHRVNDPEVPDHTVVEEVRRGYTFGGDVLRPAQVVVSVHGDEAE